MADDEADRPIRKANRAHKLRRRRKLEENPMSGGSLRRVYPAVVRRHLAEHRPARGPKDTPSR